MTNKLYRFVIIAMAIALGVVFNCCSDDDGGSSGGPDGSVDGDTDGDGDSDIDVTPVCEAGDSTGDVQVPSLLMNLSGQTSWYAPPIIYDLDGDGQNELIAAYYDIFVFNSSGELLFRTEDAESRVYAPHVVADLDGDGITEVAAGNGKNVWVWEWRNSALSVKQGWPFDTTTASESPEVRGMAASDLNGDGQIEIAVTTTQTQKSADGGAQVFVLSPDGSLFQPVDGHSPAWPRYNALSGDGNDADRNSQGHNGFGCYGLNIGLGNIDDDPQIEILATYDNHHIQAFDYDGVAIDTSPWFTNRANEHDGERLTWGQFIRWADPKVEADHYHEHTGEWPHPSWTEWLQWTASPPSVADLDLDGKNEVIGVPNIEMHEPYETQAFGVMVLEGAHGNGDRSGMRKAGWETLPRGDAPLEVEGWYPPKGVPAPTIVSVLGDERPEIIASLNDGRVHLFDANGNRLWRFNYTLNKPIMYSSEVTVADLNQDGSPELLLTTYGDPNTTDSGHLFILGAGGKMIHDIPLPSPGNNGNGNGAPAAPTVGDLDGDGQLEIFIQTFDHGMDVFTVPGSSNNCILWSTARGGPLRTGAAHSLK
jgi:FG-GAP-like repeat